MNFNFELILFYLVLGSGIISLLDILFFAKARQFAGKNMPILVDYARGFFPVLFFVFCLRSFVFETFRIPSGSLEPTLLVGDFIVVNKFAYGVRLPVIHQKIFSIGEPKRGDIFVFYWPPNTKYYLIKRVIGLPGDKISYIDKTLFINGIQANQQFENKIDYQVEETMPADQKSENLLGHPHQIYQFPSQLSYDFKDLIVPEGMYFAMGDNRDDSADSRYFGFVPESNIVGRADLKWFSWDMNHYSIRWNRLFKPIY